jgi:hypothetical protein
MTESMPIIFATIHSVLQDWKIGVDILILIICAIFLWKNVTRVVFLALAVLLFINSAVTIAMRHGYAIAEIAGGISVMGLGLGVYIVRQFKACKRHENGKNMVWHPTSAVETALNTLAPG